MNNLREIIFVTNNSYKFQIAKKQLKNSSFKLVQKKLNTPEIQDKSVKKVAEFSARWASNVLNKPVVVSDGGCYIKVLNGFPGPFIKYVNKWLSPKDLIAIMKNEKNRSLEWRSCLTYCEPKGDPISFISIFKGKVSNDIGKNIYREKYGWIDSLFVPDGYTKPLSELLDEDYLNFWKDNSWKRLLSYLKKNKNF